MFCTSVSLQTTMNRRPHAHNQPAPPPIARDMAHSTKTRAPATLGDDMPTAPPSADRLGVSSTLEMADSGAGATRHTTAAPGRAATPVRRKADLSQLGPVDLQQLLHVALHMEVR